MSTVDPAEAIRGNREGWECESRAYQREHAEFLADNALARGIWRIPESRLRLLGDVRDKPVLEWTRRWPAEDIWKVRKDG